MDIHEPSENMFTFYSKSNCIYCAKVEVLLDDYFEQLNDVEINKYKKINCDKYLNDKIDKQCFINFIEKLANIKPNSFPMVFYDNKFIGGFEETQEYLKGKMLKFDDDF